MREQKDELKKIIVNGTEYIGEFDGDGDVMTNYMVYTGGKIVPEQWKAYLMAQAAGLLGKKKRVKGQEIDVDDPTVLELADYEAEVARLKYYRENQNGILLAKMYGENWADSLSV